MEQKASVGPVRVAVAGASGLVGSALVAALAESGHAVVRLVRHEPRSADELRWDPAGEWIDPAALAGIDAVVNLAGRGIADGRWTPRVKTEIRESRVRGTRTLAAGITATDRRPQVWVNASAVGFYGDRGDEPLDEASGPGTGFLAETCRAWEAETAPAVAAGVRVVLARLGVVLSPAGGALAKMLPPTRAGLGARLGSGRQYMSWIGLGDAVGALLAALVMPDLSGPVNVTAPVPVTNAEFTRTLGRVLSRRSALVIPEFAVRALFGEMGRETLLASARVLPRALERVGFAFPRPDLEATLRHELGRQAL